MTGGDDFGALLWAPLLFDWEGGAFGIPIGGGGGGGGIPATGMGGGGGGGGGIGPLEWLGCLGLLLAKVGGGGRAGPLFCKLGLLTWCDGDFSTTFDDDVLIGGGGGGTPWLYPGTGGTGRDGGGGGAAGFSAWTWGDTWKMFKL